MRVNISYTVELDDVLKEVERMLIECNTKMRGIHGDLSQTIGREPLVMLEEIDKLRLKMAATDFQLDDCMRILSGYIQTLSRLPELTHGAGPSGTEISEETPDE